MVHRHQLDRVDTDALEVLDDDRMCHAGVGAAQLFRNVRVALREALDVRLVDDRIGVLVIRRAVVGPVEVRVDHHRLGHAGGGVVVVAAVGISEVVAEQRLVPLKGAVDGLRIRVDQQLVRVAAEPGVGLVRAVDAVAVALARLDVRDVCVPDEAVDLGQRDPGLSAVGVEQAQLHTLGHLAEHSEIGARTVIGRTQRVGPAGPHFASGGRSAGICAGHGADNYPLARQSKPLSESP